MFLPQDDVDKTSVNVLKEYWKEDVKLRWTGLLSAKSLWSHVLLLNWCNNYRQITR